MCLTGRVKDCFTYQADRHGQFLPQTLAVLGFPSHLVCLTDLYDTHTAQ